MSATKKSGTGILILAAGGSNRLGEPKQLLPVAGATLLEHAIKAATQSKAARVVVVLGHQADEIADSIQTKDISVVVNPDWEKGMGSSLKAGLTEMSDMDCIILSVCDQPFLSSDVFNALIGEWEQYQKDIVASSYQGTVGVPALFDKKYFKSLRELPDDAGAKRLLFEKKISTIPFPAGATDIDTRQDWKEYLNTGH